MPRLSRSSLTAAATAALVGSVLFGGGAAWAAWSVSGTGSGATAASSLVTPVVTATRSTTSPTSAIDLSWTASGQLTGASYTVTRNGTTIACTTSPCTDSGLAPGTTYSYVVTAKTGTSWSAASAPASASTGTPSTSTTTTVQSSQNPAKSGAAVTLTATVAAASGTPTGTVTFKDGTNTISCTGGSNTLSGGSATCQTSFASVGSHPITAVYGGDSTFATSTSGTLNQRIVNATVTGLAFANVKVGSSAVTPTCSNPGTSSVTCSVTGGNSAILTTDVGFVSSAASPTVYATDTATTLPWTASSKGNTASGNLSVAAGTTTAGSATITKNGSNSATITVTFSDGANSFTATLTIN